MELRLERFEFGTNYTIGELFIGELHQCMTLERGVVEANRKPAIPYGTYSIILNQSNRFKCILPLLLNVPGYEGIRIHSGNSDKDTEGCILVGKSWSGGDWILNSKPALAELMYKFQSHDITKDPITIDIVERL